MNKTGIKVLFALALVGIVSMPFASSALTIDPAFISYVKMLNAKITALKAENVKLKAEIADLKDGKVGVVDSSCSELSDKVSKLESDLVAYEQATSAGIKAIEKSMAGASASAVQSSTSSYVTQRNAGWTKLSDEKNATKTKYSTECL